MRRAQKLMLAQRRAQATVRYLRALTNAQAHKEDIEASLMLLHRAARKAKGVQFTAPATRWLSMYLDLLVTRIDLLSLNLSPKAARALTMLRVTEDSEGDLPNVPKLQVIDGGRQDMPRHAPDEPPSAPA